jgi:MATE family multidrug resistance protein
MSTVGPQVRLELKRTLKLAAPLALAELGWMTMGVVDTIMAGHAGRDLLGAVALGHGLYYTFAVFGIGMIFGLDTLVSQSYGRGDLGDCRRSLAGGLIVSFLLAGPLTALAWMMDPVMAWMGVEPGLRSGTMAYLRAISLGTLPLMLYSALRRYLQAQNVVRPVAFALVTANLVNLGANWVLIYGKLGFPALGAAGSGYATALARVYMVVLLCYATVAVSGWEGWTAWPGWRRVREIVALGTPAALQISFEVAVFALTTTLLGRLGTLPLGGHQIALNLASVTYMVPLGISSAAAVRVGQSLGAKDWEQARRAGWVGIGLGAAFMSLAAILFWTFPMTLASVYTRDEAVIAMAAGLLGFAAWFQLFDGIQAVATGALRGLGDTRTPLYTHVVCYWVIGLPVGWWLAFERNWGARGLWAGLTLALILIGIVLLNAWRRRIASLRV